MSTTAIFAWALALGLSGLSATKAMSACFKIEFFISILTKSVITCETNAELEFPTAAHVILVVIDRNTVIQPERSQARNIQSYPNTPVIRIILEVEIIRIEHDITNVVEDGKLQSLHNRNRVIHRSKVKGIATHRLTVQMRADGPILKSAQGIHAAQEKAVKQRHFGKLRNQDLVGAIPIGLNHSSAA